MVSYSNPSANNVRKDRMTRLRSGVFVDFCLLGIVELCCPSLSIRSLVFRESPVSARFL